MMGDRLAATTAPSDDKVPVERTNRKKTTSPWRMLAVRLLPVAIILVVFSCLTGVDSFRQPRKVSESVVNRTHLPATRPNVIIILADDLGIGDLPLYAGENTVIKTPNIDRLAAGGVVLDRYYVQPACSPTRAALMTGRYPNRYGMQNRVIMAKRPYSVLLNETFIAQSFQAAGYQTHSLGKWHLGYCTWGATPTFRGFDTFYGYFGGEVNYFTQVQQGYFDWHHAERAHCGEDCMQTLWGANGTYNADLLRDETIRIIESYDPAGAPLFMYVSFENPHAPCSVPGEWVEQYRDAVSNAPRQIYAANVAAMDAAIGKILKTLEAKQMMQDTIILFSGDNGAPIKMDLPWGTPKASGCDPDFTWGQDTGGTNYPFRGSKETPYEGGVRAAGIIHYPRKLPAGVRFDGLMHISDWYPTLLAATGVADAGMPRDAFPLDGHDFWSALSAGQGAGRETLLVHYDPEYTGGGVMIQGSQKLYVGGPFKYGDWQFPPEVGLARGWSEAESPRKGEDVNCPEGCVFDLVEDPYEQGAPRPASEELVALFRATIADTILPSLNARFDQNDPQVDIVAQAHGGVWWPYGCKDMGAPRIADADP